MLAVLSSQIVGEVAVVNVVQEMTISPAGEHLKRSLKFAGPRPFEYSCHKERGTATSKTLGIITRGRDLNMIKKFKRP
jgi:hypothetical protein